MPAPPMLLPGLHPLTAFRVCTSHKCCYQTHTPYLAAFIPSHLMLHQTHTPSLPSSLPLSCCYQARTPSLARG